MWCISFDIPRTSVIEVIGLFLELRLRDHRLLRKGLTVCLFTFTPSWSLTVSGIPEAQHGCLRARINVSITQICWRFILLSYELIHPNSLCGYFTDSYTEPL